MSEENEDRRFSQYIYQIENIFNELVIVLLSFGAIFVPIYMFLYHADRFSFLTLGEYLAPWVIMVALMIIARELWLINNKLSERDLG